MGFIYKIVNPSGRIYIGKTINIKSRIQNYKYDSHKKLDNIIQRSIRKHGWDNHTIEVIEEVDNTILSEREMFWIKEYKSCILDSKQGMNMTYGGEGGEWKHDVGRVKIYSERMTTSNPWKGKNHTKEWKIIKSKEVREYNKRNNITLSVEAIAKGREMTTKKVIMYDNKGSFVRDFFSISEASKEIGSKIETITNSIINNVLIRGQYVFKYKTKEYPLSINVSNCRKKIDRKPIYWLSEDLEPIVEFPSSKKVSIFFGIKQSTIKRAVQTDNFNPLRTGHIFCYKENYLEEYKLIS